MFIPNLLLIAGTGTKSGKTTMACRIIEHIRRPDLIGIKITPHFHETTPGLLLISEGKGHSIYKETNANTTKDTSRMLMAGASQVYFAKVTDNNLFDAFTGIMEYIPGTPPIICESPALRQYIEPGLFIIMSSIATNKQKDINDLLELPHVMFTMEKLKKIKFLPISFNNGEWLYEGESQGG
jgi:hypothetical protein